MAGRVTVKTTATLAPKFAVKVGFALDDGSIPDERRHMVSGVRRSTACQLGRPEQSSLRGVALCGSGNTDQLFLFRTVSDEYLSRFKVAVDGRSLGEAGIDECMVNNPDIRQPAAGSGVGSKC